MNLYSAILLCGSMMLCACASVRAGTSDSPVTQPDASTPEVWLQRIEAAADDVANLQARVILTTSQPLLGDEQRRYGTLLYEAADGHARQPARFRLDFRQIVIDNTLEERPRSYIFDGSWLAEKLDDERIFIRRQLVPEMVQGGRDGAAGPNMLDLGEGPFVLPLNLKKDRVLQRFEVVAQDPAEGDPDNTIHLTLTPRSGVEVDEEQIDFWFDRARLVPVRVHTIKFDQTEQRIDLRNIETNADLGDAAFDTSPPHQPGWEVQIVPFD